MYRVDVIGDEALAAKMVADANKIIAAQPYWISTVGTMVKESIQANIMSQGLIESGDLYDSARTFYQTKNGISVGVGWGLGYAEPLELGAVAHEIAGNPLLSFWWENRQDFFVGPSVQHPGNVAYRFVFQGTYESFGPILQFFFSMIRGIFGGRL